MFANALRIGLGFILALGGIGCGAVALASMLLAALSRAPGAPRPAPDEGRFDVIYRPSLLTPEGRRHRRRCILAVAGLVLWGALGTLSALLGVFPQE